MAPPPPSDGHCHVLEEDGWQSCALPVPAPTAAHAITFRLLPAAVIAPLYFKGEVEFGVINQSASAFNHILGDVSLVVTQFSAIAGFAAVVDRLGEFTEILAANSDKKPPATDPEKGHDAVLPDTDGEGVSTHAGLGHVVWSVERFAAADRANGCTVHAPQCEPQPPQCRRKHFFLRLEVSIMRLWTQLLVPVDTRWAMSSSVGDVGPRCHSVPLYGLCKHYAKQKLPRVSVMALSTGTGVHVCWCNGAMNFHFWGAGGQQSPPKLGSGGSIDRDHDVFRCRRCQKPPSKRGVFPGFGGPANEALFGGRGGLAKGLN